GLVGEVRAVAEPTLDAYGGARCDELPAGFRGCGDASLARRGLARDSDRHWHAWLRDPVAGHRSESPAVVRLSSSLPCGAAAAQRADAAFTAFGTSLRCCQSCFMASSNGASTERTIAWPLPTSTASSSGDTTILRTPRRLTISRREVSGLIHATRAAVSRPTSSTRRRPCPGRRRRMRAAIAGSKSSASWPPTT